MLPVGVVLPTRNSRKYLEPHLDSLRGWIDRVAQVVAVDSESSDGTRELLEPLSKHPTVRIYEHPPGLYASWNFGIQQVTAKYTYVSTAGDRITPAGLEHLVAVAEALDADVVVSPPTFIDLERRPVAGRPWPIHQLVRRLPIVQPGSLHPTHAFVYAVVFGAGGYLSSILGSSASNLYRTEVLKRRPFPTDRGRVGDTFWGVENSLHVRFAITPHPCAEFLIHPVDDAAPSDGALYDRLIELSYRLLREAGSARRTAEDNFALDWLAEYLEERERYSSAQVALEQFRQAHRAWFMHPRAWRMRRVRNALRRRMKSLELPIDVPARTFLERSARRAGHLRASTG